MSVSSADFEAIFGDDMWKTYEETKPQMKSMHVVSNVRNRYASTVVTSRYNNQEIHSQQATFSIMLPDTAFITGLVIEIKGNKYEAYLKEKEEAMQEYQRAVSSGRTAGHVAVTARDSNIFTVSVNIEPQSDVTFILTYEELLVRKQNKYEMLINLHLGQTLDELRVDVHINETRPIINVEIPALRSGNDISDNVTKNEYVTVNKEDDQVVHITFHPSVEQQKAMAKTLANNDEKTETSKELPDDSKGISGQFVIEYDVERNPLGGEVLVNDGYFVHFFAPTDLKPIPKHVIFVLDVSGSMGGRKLEQLKEALKVILNELNPEDYFNLVKFSDEISVLNNHYVWKIIDIPAEAKFPQSFVVNAKNIKAVQKVVDQMTNEDCTNIYDALIVGLRLTSKGIANLEETFNKHKPQPIVVFLTDGQPNVSESDPKKIIEMVEKRNDCDNKSAVFTLAFGEDADKEFLKELAIRNSGFLRNIYVTADASLQLQNFYKQISSPLLTNVNFKYSEEVNDVTKNNFDILFNGSEFVVSGRVDEMDDGFVIVEASALNGRNEFCPTVITICPKPEKKEEYGSVERLWAYMTIKQLLNMKYEKITSDNNYTNTAKEVALEKQSDVKKINKDNAEKLALQLALKYSFVTPVTSLVVVRPDEPEIEENLQTSDDCRETYDAMRPFDVDVDASDDLTFNDLISDCCTSDVAAFKCSMPVQADMKCSNKSLFVRLTDTISQLFKVKSKDVINARLHLSSIYVECNVKNHVATVLEKRIYVNDFDNPQERSFTIKLPDNTILTEFAMEIEEQVYEATRRDKKQAKEEYKNAVSKNLDAALINLREANKVIVTLHIIPWNDVKIILKYKNCLRNKNGYYDVVINLHQERRTEEMEVYVYLNETSPIKNVSTPPLRCHNKSISNVYTRINKIKENEVCIEFSPTNDQRKEITSALKMASSDGNFLGQFIVKYEVDADPSATGDSVKS